MRFGSLRFSRLQAGFGSFQERLHNLIALPTDSPNSIPSSAKADVESVAPEKKIAMKVLMRRPKVYDVMPHAPTSLLVN